MDAAGAMHAAVAIDRLLCCGGGEGGGGGC